MHFVDAVQIGEFVECRCKVVRRTRSLVFMSGELVVGERVVATAYGVWKTLGKRRGPVSIRHLCIRLCCSRRGRHRCLV